MMAELLLRAINLVRDTLPTNSSSVERPPTANAPNAGADAAFPALVTESGAAEQAQHEGRQLLLHASTAPSTSSHRPSEDTNSIASTDVQLVVSAAGAPAQRSPAMGLRRRVIHGSSLQRSLAASSVRLDQGALILDTLSMPLGRHSSIAPAGSASLRQRLPTMAEREAWDAAAPADVEAPPSAAQLAAAALKRAVRGSEVELYTRSVCAEDAYAAARAPQPPHKSAHAAAQAEGEATDDEEHNAGGPDGSGDEDPAFSDEDLLSAVAPSEVARKAVYVLARPILRAAPGSGVVRRWLVEDVYGALQITAHHTHEEWEVPAGQLIEVGMLQSV